MIAKIYSAIPKGYYGKLVEVEGDTNLGLPAFNIVGMGGKTITEARERVRSAITNSHLTFPNKKMTINLAPADLIKDGTYLDLPIALSIVMLNQQLRPSDVTDSLFVGELSLDGSTKPVRGIINIVETAAKAHFCKIYIPTANFPQASLISDIEIYGVSTLLDLYLHLKGEKPLIQDNLAVNREENVVSTTATPAPNSIVVNPTTPKNRKNVVSTTNTSITHQPNVVKSTTKFQGQNNVVNFTITEEETHYLTQNAVKNTTNTEFSPSSQIGEVPNTDQNSENSQRNLVENTQTDQDISAQNTQPHQFQWTQTINKSENVKNTQTEYDTHYLDDICGQTVAKRAITIAIAGHHNLLLVGPPGTGKTLLAKTSVNLLPPPSNEEAIAITKLSSLLGNSDTVILTRPFRAPHHTASSASIIGGGSNALPGEISMAHHGILFLDEIPEFPRNVLEALRQPLEDKTISITRLHERITYPADFMLIATMNPCPCGYLGDPTHVCTCTEQQISAYHKRISGPILDRIDLVINLERPTNTDYLHTKQLRQNSEHLFVKNTITETIKIQAERYQKSGFFNSSLTSSQIQTQIHLDNSCQHLLEAAINNLNLSARAYFKIIRVAQTIADLAKSPKITTEHLTEALTYRQRPLVR